MPEARSLSEWFVAHVPPARRPADDQLPALEAALSDRLAAAREVWPTVALAPEMYASYLADKVAELEGGPVLELLGRLAASDLYLALACAGGDAEPMSLLRSRYFPDLDGVLRHLGAQQTLVDEVKQRMLTLLFVVDGERPPRIGTYSGRGDLRSWLRSFAVRTCLKMMAQDRRTAWASDEDLSELAPVHDDPELDHLKKTYAAEFREALKAALASLPQRQRNLLRLFYLDGLSIDELGRLFRVHRLTAARWVVAARDMVFEETRLRLCKQMGVGDSEFTSIVRLVQSQLDLSVSRLLGGGGQARSRSRTGSQGDT